MRGVSWILLQELRYAKTLEKCCLLKGMVRAYLFRLPGSCASVLQKLKVLRGFQRARSKDGKKDKKEETPLSQCLDSV